MGCVLYNATIPALGIQYAQPFGWNIPTALGFNYTFPVDGTLSQLVVRTANNQPLDGDLIITTQLSFLDTALAILIPAGSPSASYFDILDRVSVLAGTVMRWKIVNNSPTLASAQLG